MDTENKTNSKGTEKNLWGRLPKSTAINFGALCILFLAIFLLHHFSDSIINNDKSAGASKPAEIKVEAPIKTEESVRLEKTALVEQKQEVVLKSNPAPTEVEAISPKVVSMQSVEATPELASEKTDETQTIVTAEKTPEVVLAKEIPSDKNAAKVKQEKQQISKPEPPKIIAATRIKKKTVAKNSRAVPRAIEVGASVEDLDGEYVRRGYLSQTVRYMQKPKPRVAQTYPTTQYRKPPPQPTYSQESIYIPFEKKDK
ncbi:MAG: hypothetical protein HN337_07725 [Deltaproteobacteria bacterium]|jgi:hypothetical protein|nr:hypothetical protein [Deltaproteobacteria bacterium]